MDKFSTAANAIINQLVQIHENSTSESTSLPACLIMSENRPSWLSGVEVNASLEVGAIMQEERIFKTPSGVDRRRCNVESSSKGPHFTMRGYVLGVRREDLKKTWPFSQKHLRLWLERGKEPLLPPLDSPHPHLSSQDHHNCQQSEQAIISKEEESFDTRATELQVSSKEGSTLPESELDINIIKIGNSSEKQWPKTVPEIYCNRIENRNIRQISSKLSRRRNQLVCRRKRTAKGKVGKKLLDSEIRSFPFNELEYNFLKKRNAAKVRIDNTSVDSSREDAVVDLAGKVRTVSQGQDLCTKERCDVVQHTVEISQSVKDRSNNCKAEECNTDIQAQESTSSLSPVQLLNSSKENAETQGKGICHEGEISHGECEMSTLKECAMEFDVEEDEGTSQLRGELMGASEGKAEYRNENLIIARKDFANQEEQEQNDEKANRHEVTKEITRVLEDTPSKTADVELAKKFAEVGVGAMISDSLIPKMCPVCRKFVSTSNTALNAHIDHCLTVGAPFGDLVRLQKNRRKQKIRSIADICAKLPTSMLDQKTAKNMNLTLSSCILDWKGRRMQQKCRISALKPWIKLYSDKEASKRRRTVSDFENFCKHKTKNETGKPRHTIGIKRKQQTILDSDNHLNWDTSKSSTTSVSNFPSKSEQMCDQAFAMKACSSTLWVISC
ncbi:hypothetical protein O6H91_15G085700 [Diphasiastrum complanatum]|uniref:Uncharacterized protein n=1 Tax=Diphasiastrum complanatum TaxID=34168 RepID=A0ACC2BKF8_DIPCM|nr:hypothetical protein O6H91_15G085700 [Diphasiastrum complanatum]